MAVNDLYFALLGKMLSWILRKRNVDTCFQSVRPLDSFLNCGKALTRGDLVFGVCKIPCSCGKFYIGRTHNNLCKIYWVSQLNRKNPTIKKASWNFFLALAEHTFFHREHFIQFDEATAISNDRGFSQWAREAIEIKKYICLLIFQ